jgi:hypothetical protein
LKERMMKKIVLVLVVVLVAAGVAGAANLPSGVTGLWNFDDSANLGKATVGTDLITNAYQTGGPHGGALNTWIGTWANVTGGLTANGGGIAWDPITWEPATRGGIKFVNEYSVAMDIMLPAVEVGSNGEWRSLLQTADTPMGNDGDMWIAPDGSVGAGSNYSATGVFATDGTWYRVVMAADLGNFFKVYVNGTEVLNIAGDNGAELDGGLSLYDYSVSFFSDAWGYDGPVICDTLAYWNRTLDGTEVASMGDISTAMTVPEPATMSLLALGGIALLRRNRK